MTPPDVWLRGPVPEVAPVLQPVAHALLQVLEDVPGILNSLSPGELWARPGGSAAIGFHAIHLAGSTERLFTYARGEALSDGERETLELERAAHDVQPGTATVLNLLTSRLDTAITSLTTFPAERVFDAREVGGARLPSTVLGLLFHAAEHATRHAGQITTLARIVRD